ncbi:class I SAM-dependent methyltransferase [Acuticoccus mangrovi]|uniref:Methyltransferase domain-containing protein n=1 Tax=Acuticoccus mangrovi TaxID=2796142 RepID=A0A934IDR0_9HYPH|nr:methyltransferase domain-containing protein [Acuticoccus mangrovi]MBJ3774663.1 methyltransferase domain-containing protein [Acuticoccus mangrovi]
MGKGYVLDADAAVLYEAQKVPAIFAPLAAATLAAVAPSAGATLLDLACGTGILARTARRRLGSAARVVGLDLSAAMIEVAAGVDDPAAGACEWVVGSALALPFADASFSDVLCQQGMQYVPDVEAAAAEIHRVLKPGGRVALTVWGPPNLFFTATAAALERHAGPEIARDWLSPFDFDGRSVLPAALLAAGFGTIETAPLVVERVMALPEISFPAEILSNPIGPKVAALGEDVLPRVVADAAPAVARHVAGDRVVMPQEALIVTATHA